jgi:exopolysaccharide biosynthesis polyprenyl glycosylphosphotransferase
LMHMRALSEQPPPPADGAPSPPLAIVSDSKATQVTPRRSSAMTRIAEQEWAPALVFFICDVVCWVGIYGSLSFLRRDAFYSSGFEYAVIEVIQLAVIVQSLFIIGGYSARVEIRGLTYTAEHILAMLAALAVSSLLLYAAATFDQTMKPSRSAVLASFVLFTPVSLLYRRALRKRVVEASANRAFLVIGAGELASHFYKAYCLSGSQQRLEFVDLDQSRVGQCIAGPGSPLIEGDLMAKLSEASRRYSGIILAENVDRILPDLLGRLIRAQFQRTRVYTLESFYEAHWRHVPMYSIDPYWPLQMGFQLSRTSPYHYLKRLFDVIASASLLVICSPLMVLIGGLIWVTNGRPVIFRQQRVGRDEELFTLYKFRTMKGEAAVPPSPGYGVAGSGPAFAKATAGEQKSAVSEDDIYTREDDPRISRLGWWLRKLRLDELPQLWNVLQGSMSLIGPRAEWVECVQRYEKKIPLYHFRHLVKPGITGWAQVNYPYGESEEDAVEKLKYDLYYIRHYSLTLDAMIVLKTIHTMLFGKGR